MADLLLPLAAPALILTYVAGRLIGRWCERGRIADFVSGRNAFGLAYNIRHGVHRGRKP